MISQAWKALLPAALLTSFAAADLCAGGEWDVIVVGKGSTNLDIEDGTDSIQVLAQQVS
jgi:cellobiose dehydrogenase (acceptor)